MKTLSTNVSSGQTGESQPVYLIEIDRGSGNYLRWSTIDTDDFTNSWTGTAFDGARLAWLGTVDMQVDILDGGGLHETYDFEFAVLNQDDYHSTLDGYNLYNKTITVKLIFESIIDPSWANACEIFKGIIYDWTYDQDEVVIKCTSFDKKYHRKLPEETLTTAEFDNLPPAFVGKAAPFCYGSYGGPSGTWQAGFDAVRAIRVDRYSGVYMPFYHADDAAGALFYYDSQLDELCPFASEDTTDGTGYSQLASSKHYHVIDDQRVDKISRMSSAAIAEGNEFEDDVYNVADGSYSSVIMLDKNAGTNLAKLYLQDTYVDDSATLTIYYKLAWSQSPMTDYVTIKLYDEAFSNLLKTITNAADEDGTTPTDFTTEWATSEKTGIGIELKYVNAGDNYNVDFYEIWIKYEDVFIDDLGDVLYSSADGRAFTAWVDADSRSNGYNEGDLVAVGVYVIEDILRNYLDLTSSDIDYVSFDAAGNSSTGTRKDWELAGQQNEFVESRELLQKLVKQQACIMWENAEGKIQIKAINLSESAVGTITATQILVADIETGKSSLKRYLTALESVYNDFELYYKYDWVHSKCSERLYCNASGKSASISSGYDTKCSSSVTKYGITRKLVFEADWVRDADTAADLLEFLVDWYVNRREIIEFDTNLRKVELELGDVWTINNTFVNDQYICIGIQHDCDSDIIHTKWVER